MGGKDKDKDKGKDKGKDKKDDKKDKKDDKKDKKNKKDVKVKTKDEKKQKNDKISKMSKDEKKAYKKGKVEKKIELKKDLMSVNVYDPKVFADYSTKVNAAKQEISKGNRAEIGKRALVELEQAGTSIGIKVWRIEQFHIVPIPQANYGEFYSGDSYVVLNTYKIENMIKFDLHFWIGEHSTQDEYGAAAVWTVQIDDKLGGKAVQHREVQDFESEKFLSLFSPGIRILQGGIESAFNKVDRDAHRVRLLKIKGKKQVRITEVEALTCNLNSGDVFVLDTLNEIFVFIGKESSVFEKQKGGEMSTAIRNQRGGKPKIVTIEEARGDNNDVFWENLGGKGPIPSAAEGGDDALVEQDQKTVKKTFQAFRQSWTN